MMKKPNEVAYPNFCKIMILIEYNLNIINVHQNTIFFFSNKNNVILRKTVFNLSNNVALQLLNFESLLENELIVLTFDLT